MRHFQRTQDNSILLGDEVRIILQEAALFITSNGAGAHLPRQHHAIQTQPAAQITHSERVF